MLNYALDYQKKSVSIIPLGTDKRPLISEWKEFQERKATVEEVTAWWTKWPEANIGIVTGKISGVTVVDFDVKRDESGKEIAKGDRTAFPLTTIITTPNGGFHYYYSYTDKVKNAVNFLPLVDIRNDGGYVVAPPSKIIGSGNKLGGEYKVFSNYGRRDFPIHLFGFKETNSQAKLLDIAKGVTAGGRNISATSLIGKLLKQFKTEDWPLAWELFKTWDSKNTPPLGERELRTVFDSIARAESGRRNEDEVVLPEDDSEVLPISEVAKFYEKTSEAISTGYVELDNAMRGGMIEGDLIVLSGETGHGKTAMCQSMTYNLANNKVPTVWFSYEVGLDEIWKRFKDMGVSENFISYSPLKMIMSNPTWITKKIVEAKEKYGTKVVFIDHLGFLEKDTSKSNDPNLANNGAYKLASLCRDFKRIAIDNNIIIVLMAHVRRPAFATKGVGINDLAYSAGIAQESDHVLMISRNEENGQMLNTSKLKLVKNRRTGKLITVDIMMQNGRFVPATTQEVAEETKKSIQVFNQFK